MNEPSLIPRDALSGQRIALSVSESADLARLGLTEKHCRLVVAEVGRAIMLAGATVVYGGNLQAGGYTEILIEEAQRFSSGRIAIEIALAESEYKSLPAEALRAFDRGLGEIGRLTLVPTSGHKVPAAGTGAEDVSHALTTMREYVVAHSTVG